MKRLIVLAIASALGGGTIAGCSSGSDAGSDTPQAISKVKNPLINSDEFLYLTCNSTGWSPAQANRLKSTSTPGVFTLEYQVTQPWQVSSPDQCSFLLTNQLNGYGTSQTRYADSHPGTPVQISAVENLLASTANFAIKYPATGTYDLTVDWNRQRFSLRPKAPGVIGKCGIAQDGASRDDNQSTPEVYVDYVLVYESASTKWCVDANVWATHAADVDNFFSYGDAVYAKLQDLSDIHPSEKFVYQVFNITGGAGTGSDFGLGVSVTGDAFYNVDYDPVSERAIPGFWGYLLTLHEAINDFTGLVTPGWPPDWWADHRSPFPNALDILLLEQIGTEQGSQALLDAASYQNYRFGDPARPGYDSEVGMFLSLYDQYGGYSAFTNAFQLIQQDGLNWDTVAPHAGLASPLLTEYVLAYLQLGLRTTQDLTESLFLASGVGWLDTGVGPYTVDVNAVHTIASAHCSIRAAASAGVDVSTHLDALRHGDYLGALATGGSAATCPSECAYSNFAGCVARF